ncbi:MAG: DegV family protein, partial [Jeotgalicoccus sp.]
MALYAAQNIDEKPLEELIKDVNEMKQKGNMNAFFLVDTLTNLQKGGRLSNAQAFIGGLLKIKPILEFQDGKIVAIEKIRTQKKAMLKIEGMLQAEFDKHEGKRLTACLIHGNAPELGMRYKNELEEKFPQVKFVLQEFGPVVGTHLGQGAIGIGFTTYNVDTTGL